jgi:hypothetical protein
VWHPHFSVLDQQSRSRRVQGTGAKTTEESRQVVENKRWDVREILKDSKNNRSSPPDTGMLPVLDEWFDGRSGPTLRESNCCENKKH